MSAAGNSTINNITSIGGRGGGEKGSGTGKKRKVAGSPGSSSSTTTTTTRTMPTSVGSVTPEQLQAATGMGSEAATAYLAATAAAGAASSSQAGNGATTTTTKSPPSASPPQVKISFGPSRPPSHTTTCTPINNYLGGIDLETLKERAAAAVAAASIDANSSGNESGNDNNNNSSSNFLNKQGLPCTETEMKALMSMFVEIMGMSINNNNNPNSNSTTGKGGGTDASAASRGGGGGDAHSGPVFSFGTTTLDAHDSLTTSFADKDLKYSMTSEQLANLFSDGSAFEALRRTFVDSVSGGGGGGGGNCSGNPPAHPNYNEYPYSGGDHDDLLDGDHDDDDEEYDEDYDDDDSIEGEPDRELTFEEVEFILQHRKQQAEATRLSKQFSSGDWESLEQGAVSEYQLEAEDQERKAAKKRDKKQRKKAKQKEEAAQKAAEAAQKEREKAIVSWRSRVVSSCQSNETGKLESLLQESPLRKLPEEEGGVGNLFSQSRFNTHLEFLLPNTVAKNRAHVERGVESRLRLADYVLGMELALAFKAMRSGRPALHTACFFGDVRFVKLVFDKVDEYQPGEGQDALPDHYLNMTCEESGWSPLHYAALSGSSEVLELLLERGPNLRKLTDPTHTWRDSDGLGMTARELVECVMAGKQEKEIESHGVALLDVTNAFLNQSHERRTFLRRLERVQQRLASVEKNGYVAPPLEKADSAAESEVSNEDSASNVTEGGSSRKKNRQKKKKKKKPSLKESQTETQHEESVDSQSKLEPVTKKVVEVDPLVSALLGMGFNETQIAAAAKACGGTHRATADDLVTWILTQGAGEDDPDEPAVNTPSEIEQKNEVQWEQVSKDVDSEITDLTFEKEQKEQVAKQQKEEEAARRLAAKREEARRRNREWNDREQARHKQEAKAKVVQKAFAAVQQSANPMISQNGLHVGLPSVGTVNPGPHVSSSPVGVQLQDYGTHGVSAQAVAPSEAMASSQWAPSVQPAARMQSFIPADPTSVGNMAPPAVVNPLVHPTQQPSQAGFVSFSQINDDDRTVSSFGSNRGLSVSSREYVPSSFSTNTAAPPPPVPPPGFMASGGPAMSMPLRPPVSTVPEHSSSVSFADDESQGEIRATAKAFVPSAFSHSTAPVLPHRHGFGLPDSSMLSHTQMAPQHSPAMGIPPGLMAHHNNGPSSGISSLLGTGLSNTYERVPPMTPVSEDSTTAGTSIPGLGSKTSLEDPPISIALGLTGSTLGDPIQGNPIGGSSLLGSISRGRSVGGSTIWGDSSSSIVPSLGDSLHPSFFGDGGGNADVSGQPSMNNESKRFPWEANARLPGTGRSQSGGSIW